MLTNYPPIKCQLRKLGFTNKSLVFGSFCLTTAGAALAISALESMHVLAPTLGHVGWFLKMPIPLAICVATIVTNSAAILPGIIGGKVRCVGKVRAAVMLTCFAQMLFLCFALRVGNYHCVKPENFVSAEYRVRARLLENS